MPDRTVTYTLQAAATGIDALREVRREVEAIAAVRFNFEGQVANMRQVAQDAARTSVKSQIDATRAAAAAEKQAATEQAQRMRDHQATVQLNIRLQAQASQAERAASRQSIEALDNQQRAYRNMWQARQLTNDQSIAAQQRIQGLALQQAATLDRTSDAYRRLTQVAAASQRTIDSANGVNTPGGFSSGISQGIQSVLSQYGVAGNLLNGFVQLISTKKAAAVNTARDLGHDTIQGMVQGLRSQKDEVTRAARATADAVDSTIKKDLDIQSPSRVMEYLGRMSGMGFVQGLRGTRDEAQRAALALSTAAQNGARMNGSATAGRFVGMAGGFSGGGFGGAGTPAVRRPVPSRSKG